MLKFLTMILAVLFWVQPVIAHDSPEEIAAQAAAAKKEQLEYENQQNRQGTVHKHGRHQEYVQWVNQWKIRLQIFPQSYDSGISIVRLFIRNKDNNIPNLNEASLLLMKSGRKVVMTKKPEYFSAGLRLPKSRESIIMVKMKTKHGKVYFAKFQH